MPSSVVTKEHPEVSPGLRGRPGAEGAQRGRLGLTSPARPLVLLQLRFPAHCQLQLLPDHLDLLLQLHQLLHHGGPRTLQGVCLPVGGQRGGELSPPWRERDVLGGPRARLVLSSLLTEDVFSWDVVTLVGSIPHGELAGSHAGPRKQRGPVG